MDFATIFSLSSLLVMPFWFLMTFLPHWRVTKRTMRSPLISLAPAFVYLVLVLPLLGEVLTVVSNPTLQDIARLLSSPAGATLAWLHFLAFDLFIGRWIYLDSREKAISAWFVSPILYLTLMLGPVGFASYLGLRAVINAVHRRNDRSGQYYAAQV
jgi:hypothetical protein